MITTPIEFCGTIAALFACCIVIAGLLLFALLGFCFLLGAADSIVNPHASEDSQMSYKNVTTEIGAGTVDLNQAVRNVTTGGQS